MNLPPVNWQERYSASLIISIQVRTRDIPGTLGTLLTTIGKMRTPIGDVRLTDVGVQYKTREIQMFFRDQEHMNETLTAISMLPDVELVSVTDEVLEVRRGGTIETHSRVRLETPMDLRMVAAPGVGIVCELLSEDPSEARVYTGIASRVAIVTNGTSVLGLGDIGVVAALPAIEGRAALLARFARLSAAPVMVDSREVNEFVNIVSKIASAYGAIQLEDIAAPACFEIEEALVDRVGIPVFNAGRHGTATVCIAAVTRALELTQRTVDQCRAVVAGAGAAGQAIARALQRMGLAEVILCDSVGAIYEGRSENMDRYKAALAGMTNPEKVSGKVARVVEGRDLLIGVSEPGRFTSEMVSSMAEDPIVFALSPAGPEIEVADALSAGAAVALDNRSVDDALVYPGMLRGALEARAQRITESMMVAAAQALAAAAGVDAVLPHVLDESVHHQVAEAVRNAWDEHES